MPDERNADVVPCTIYKGRRRPDVYLYLSHDESLDCVPDSLLEALGPLEEVMTLELHPGRPLAQADVHRVMQLLREQGFYLQLPPQREYL